ncbi:filamentous hemagglutinin N-terminal domain-containing protein [Helicobacter canadensis]|uniref:Filamentous hemagglutinin domain protein n=2 Tax=Helicobacter canadensis TaxID=123841 RepID=C5ZVY1_9HELI|nr:filamentous hemagglutinin N-terminal domain-containing protein [Helicobacter canadensis]EES89062.1 putative filamentous hemagglutinin domain protein [Helicobacter canadensis MIT 98-5491]EFR47838.1 filamentous hemeagglutinin family domain protein [Helicobacter canadensis MIT 98-5491]
MNIAGNKTHNVIAWGGGFNIGKDASVNFTTEQKNYLNLDYTNKASQILGKLNGGTNNIYLVNPSGVLIGKDASINANKFGVSTSPMDMTAINNFSTNGSFSPVFKANKGDVVNMGAIKANEVSLIAKEVGHGGVINADKITLKGNVIANVGNFSDENSNKQFLVGSFNGIDGNNIQSLNLEGDTIKFQIDNTIDKVNTISINASTLAEISQSTTDIKNNGYKLNDSKLSSISAVKLDKFASIKDTTDWSNFASIINTGNANNIDTFKLINDIDFNNTLIDPVGDDANQFSGNFYGNNHTLSNLLINAEGKFYVGLFGYINNGNVQDLTINGLNFQYNNSNPLYTGGFAGRIDNGAFSNIVLNHIGDISGGSYTGGFGGLIEIGDFSNIILNNIGDISSSGGYAGGFGGDIENGTFSNIVLNNIGDITGNYAGGFAGRIDNGAFSNIVLNHIGDISGNVAGGFGGWIRRGSFSNIVLNDIRNISSSNSSYAGGFAGRIGSASFSDIYFYGALTSGANQNNITQHDSTALDLANGGLTTIQDHMQTDSTLKNLEYVVGTNGNSYLHMVSNGKIGDNDSNIVFNKDDNTYNLEVSNNPTSPTLPSISNGDTLSSVTLDKNDFAVEILQSIIEDILSQDFMFDLNNSSSLETILSGMDLNNLTTENIQTILEALLDNVNEADKKEVLESMKQSLEFYAEFNQGEKDGLKSLFKSWYQDTKDTYNTSMNKYTYLITKLQEIPSVIEEFKKIQGSIDDYNNKIDSSKKELQEAINAYETLLKDYKELLASYDSDDSEFKNNFNALYNTFQDNLKAFNTQLADYDAMLKDYNNGSATYNDTLNAYEALTEKYEALMDSHNSVKKAALAYQDKNNIAKGEYAVLENKINALNEAFNVISNKNYDFTETHTELTTQGDEVKNKYSLGNKTNYEGMSKGGFTFNGTLANLLDSTSNIDIPSQDDKPLLGDIEMPNDLDLAGFDPNSNLSVKLPETPEFKPEPEIPENLPSSDDGAGEVHIDITKLVNVSKESMPSLGSPVFTLPAQEEIKEEVITQANEIKEGSCIVSGNIKTSNPCSQARDNE